MIRAARPPVFVATLAAVALVVAATIADSGNGSAATARRPLRVALVFDPLGPQSQISRPALPGLKRAVRTFGIQGTAITPTVKARSIASFLSAGRQGYDLVIGLGSLVAGEMDRAARELPRTRFADVDASVSQFPSHPKNVAGFLFRDEEAGYLAGYLAGLMEKRRPGHHVVSTIGGIPVPSVDRFIAGFRAGARKADPQATLLNAYTNDFLDPAKCKRVALGQIARGSGVVFPVAGGCGLGALDAAREHHVWGIGVDSDQAFLGPHILTSAVKRWDIAVYSAIKAVVDGSYRGGTDTVLSLRDGGVGLGRISPKVPRSILARVEKIRRDIVSGRIRHIPTTVVGSTP
jgi:basic membrane protein A and related proteins